MQIVIVGGGTAGWMTTFYLSHANPHHTYYNISSDEIPIIGVGEGTTAKFTNTFSHWVDLNELMLGTGGLPKLGIKFKDWPTDFNSPIDGTYTQEYFIDYSSYVKPTSPFGVMMDKHKSPYIRKGNNLEFNTTSAHAMHIDAYKTAEFFKSRSIQNGVKYIESTVKDKILVAGDTYRIGSLVLDNGDTIEGDLFIDCSGFSRVLSEDSPWISYSKQLITDRAFVYDIPTKDDKMEYTTATAMNNGWRWEIPTVNKIGRGYVYSSKFADEDTIKKELEETHNTSVDKIKTLKFDSGRIMKFIDGNVVSIGLSSGFLEPLQATSIHCAIVQLETFFSEFMFDLSLLDDLCLVGRYNDNMAKLYDEMRDFVFLHYTGGRDDTDFWKYVSETPMPHRVKELLDLTKSRLIRSYDFDNAMMGSVGQESWNHILSGLGHFNSDLIDTVFKGNDTTVSWWKEQIDNYESEIETRMKDNLSAQELKLNIDMSLKSLQNTGEVVVNNQSI